MIQMIPTTNFRNINTSNEKIIILYYVGIEQNFPSSEKISDNKRITLRISSLQYYCQIMQKQIASKQIFDNTQANGQIDSQSDQDAIDNQIRQEEAYILNPHQYLKFCLKDKKIKVMDQCNPIMNNVYLKDISLHKKGPLEDKIYSKNNLYYCNIRRGNTLCQIYNEKQEETQLFMCRRGMKKFYDLEPEYMKVNRKLTHQHERYRRRIFEKLDRVLDEPNNNNKIHLYGLFKENGQHCQISYVQKLGYWLFASKNVAILVKDEKQLETHYEKERFYWAKLIGQQFFNILKSFPQQKKKQFIKDIGGKTLLGQHCGNEEHQHITKYDKVQIIFYGLVQNNGIDHCLPVGQCEEFLLKYGLKMSKMEKIEGLSQKNKVYFSMFKMLKKIAEGTMDECGQGSVMYIVAEDGEGKQRTVGMCKLKTCQYLIYRRMRQMIKIYFAKKGATANSFQKYKFEVQSLVQHYFKPPKPLQYYFQIAELAFEEVKRNNKQFSDEQFRYKFVNFLDSVQAKTKLKRQMRAENQDQRQQIRRVILVCPPLLAQQTERVEKLCKKLGYSIQYNYRQLPNKKLTKSILHILHIVPRLNFDQIEDGTTIITYEIDKQRSGKIVQELNQNPDIKKSHLIGLIKSQDKARAIELLNQKISAFSHSCLERNKNKNIESHVDIRKANMFQDVIEGIQKRMSKKKGQIQISQKQEQNIEEQKMPMITVVITLLIPGSGKSVLAETLLTDYSDKGIQVISSDKIRQTIMEKYKDKRRGDEVQMQQAYAATKKKGLEKYRQAVKQAIGEQPPYQHKILYIDRVFCPTTIFENIEQIKKPWTKFVIVTQIQNQAKLNDHIYPHSLCYLLGCIKRSIERQQHETLSTKPNEIVKVILKFYQMYRGFTYNKLCRQLQQANVNFQILQLDFLNENQDEADNLFLKKKVEECLKGIAPGHDAPQSPLYTQLIELIYKYSDHIERKKTEEAESQKCRILSANAEKLLNVCR